MVEGDDGRGPVGAGEVMPGGRVVAWWAGELGVVAAAVTVAIGLIGYQGGILATVGSIVVVYGLAHAARAVLGMPRMPWRSVRGLHVLLAVAAIHAGFAVAWLVLHLCPDPRSDFTDAHAAAVSGTAVLFGVAVGTAISSRNVSLALATTAGVVATMWVAGVLVALLAVVPAAAIAAYATWSRAPEST